MEDLGSIIDPVKPETLPPPWLRFFVIYSCVAQALSRGNEPVTPCSLLRNTASLLKILFNLKAAYKDNIAETQQTPRRYCDFVVAKLADCDLFGINSILVCQKRKIQKKLILSKAKNAAKNV